MQSQAKMTQMCDVVTSMIKKNLDWGYIRTYVSVDAAEGEIDVDFKLRSVAAHDLAVEWGDSPRANANLLNQPGLFGNDVSKGQANQVWYLDLTLTAPTPRHLPHTVIDVRLPFDNMQSLWLPSIQAPGKNYRPKGLLECYAEMTTHICNLAPIGAFFSAEGLNKFSFALSDCKNVVRIQGGAFEEEEAARLTFNLFEVPSHKMSQYQVSLRLDTGLMPVFNAIQNIARYYERTVAPEVMAVPDVAYGPVYSTWYAFLQNLQEKEIEEQCAIAAQCGCKTIILDDGWQTDDNNRGYAYCGDWQVSQQRFPHMKEHVQRVHELGMKYMVWFSVPFIGRKSQNGPRFKEYCLCFNSRWDAYVLDPRYKIVRDFLVKTFSHMVKEYDLDGLKLDFIDEFDMRQADEHGKAFDARRDTQSLPDAVDMLMTEVRQALESIKSDIMIEFRQNYIGPMIRKYGNMFRAHDCPNDTLMNRLTTLDVRAMALSTAVHADMFTWSPSEAVESSSLNFIHSLFAVPQISPNFKHLNDEHRLMVKHWLSFWEEHRNLLMQSPLIAEHPEQMYSDVQAIQGTRELRLIATDHPVTLFMERERAVKELTLVNGAMTTSLVLKCDKTTLASLQTDSLKLQAKIFDCLGKLIRSEEIDLTDRVQEVALPKSGYIKFTRLA